MMPLPDIDISEASEQTPATPLSISVANTSRSRPDSSVQINLNSPPSPSPPPTLKPDLFLIGYNCSAITLASIILAVEAQLMVSANGTKSKRILALSMVFELLGILLATCIFQYNQQFEQSRPLRRVVWIASVASIMLVWIGMIFLAVALLL